MSIQVRLFGCVLLASLALSAQAARKEVYALVGARVLSVSGAPLETGTVVLRDGVIEAVGARVVAPPDARVIDLRGLTLTPGLIDAFGSLGLPKPRANARAEARRPSERAARASLTPAADALDDLDLKAALEARDQGLTTALVAPRDGPLPGRSVLINLAGENAEQLVLRQPAALHLQMIPLDEIYPASLMGVMALARQALLDAAHARAAREAWERAPLGKRRPRYDAGLVAWQDVRARRLPLLVTAPRENDVRRALALRDEFGLRVIVAGTRHPARLTALLAREKVPLLISVDFDPPGVASPFGGRDEDTERADITEAQLAPAVLQRAGVPFALVSGRGKDFLAGVRTAIDKGLTRDAALRALTLEAARALGVDDFLGSLEAGKLANVVAWQGDPLSADAKAKLVFVDGALYEPQPKSDDKSKQDDGASQEVGR